MRRVDRVEDAPADLGEKGTAEFERALEYYEGDTLNEKSFQFKTYKLKSVKNALERMFHGKCAYCETFYASTQPLDVEHYRPKGAVDAADLNNKEHRGYWWEAMEWDNLLPSCIDCNRKRNQVTPKGDTSQVRLLENAASFTNSVTVGSGKKDSFPIADSGKRAMKRGDPLTAEKPLLLNPCTDDPDKHLAYFVDRDNPVSLVLVRALEGEPDFTGTDGLSLKGATSISVYGLNRLRLVQARTEVLRRLEFLAQLAIDLKVLSQDLDGQSDDEMRRAGRQISGFSDSIIDELRRMSEDDQPYSAMVNAWRVSFIERMEEIA